MLEIKCPKCGETIRIGKDDYNTLLNDIEKNEIDLRVNERITEIEKALIAKNQLEISKINNSKDNEVAKLNNQISVLKEKINNADKDIELAVSKATEKIKDDLSKRENEILTLKSEISDSKKDSALAIKEEKEKYETLLKMKDDEIKLWKEFRLGDSTKDLGESLEQYCHDAFDEIRSVAYPDAYFEKDNTVDEEGKGDFIFRDYKDGIEIVSIMFEMKNQKDTTKTKHKNSDFFDKLDKNRKSKKCEYAVLVSTLEEDSKLYNNGIVDVSHRCEKMFVVRPQFFLTIIALIRTMALNTFSYKKQVIKYQQENLDITNFESSVIDITRKISNDYQYAYNNYKEVDKMCDEIISKINTFRDKFRIAANWIDAAQNQLPNLEIKKLVKNNKTMQQKFAELENQKLEIK